MNKTLLISIFILSITYTSSALAELTGKTNTELLNTDVAIAHINSEITKIEKQYNSYISTLSGEETEEKENEEHKDKVIFFAQALVEQVKKLIQLELNRGNTEKKLEK